VPGSTVRKWLCHACRRQQRRTHGSGFFAQPPALNPSAGCTSGPIYTIYPSITSFWTLCCWQCGRSLLPSCTCFTIPLWWAWPGCGSIRYNRCSLLAYSLTHLCTYASSTALLQNLSDMESDEHVCLVQVLINKPNTARPVADNTCQCTLQSTLL
jgi:hypothetical protein